MVLLGRIFALTCLTGAFGRVVTLSNVEPIRDVEGSILAGADGNTARWADGLYWLYALDYGACAEQLPNLCANQTKGACGFSLNHSVMVYSSPDLSSGSWTLRGADVLPVARRPAGLYFRPKVVFNARTRRYVMWIRWLDMRGPRLSDDPTFYLVASSAVPAGPFAVLNANASTRFASPADESLMVDDDGAAYLIYSPRETNHTTAVDRLSDDYTRSLAVGEAAGAPWETPSGNCSGAFGSRHVEAPALFRREGAANGVATYYALFGAQCCFCPTGTNIEVHTAPSPLGPWTAAGEIGRDPANASSFTTRAQQNYVMSVPAPDGGTPTLLWQGNRWGSAPDGEFHHDYHFWAPMSFDMTERPHNISWVDTFTLQVATA